MAVFDRFFGAQAPVHLAQPFEPGHDGRFHLIEARRGRGKSYGMSYWAYLWLVDRIPAILAGDAPYSRVITNFALDRHRMALRLCEKGWMNSMSDALDLVHDRVIYASNWDDFFVSYECGLFLDECNRSLDAYNQKKSPLLSLAHDWHQQSRKHKNTLVYATQYLDWINTQTRKLFDLLWRARVVRHKTQRGPDGLKRPLRFHYYGSDPYSNGVDAQTVRRADFKFSFEFELPVARMYKSWEPIVTFPGDVEPRWESFRELSRDMEARHLKPGPIAPPPNWLSLYRAGHVNWDAVAPLVDIDLSADGGIPAGLVPDGVTTAAPRLVLPDAFDPSAIATGFPKHLL